MNELVIEAAGPGILTLVTAILTLVSALAGVLVGGLLEGRRQKEAFQREKALERERERIQKLELVAVTAYEVSASLERAFVHLHKGSGYAALERPNSETVRRAMQELELGEKELVNSRAPYLMMLVSCHAPGLLDHMASVWTAHGPLYESISSLFGEDDERRRAITEFQKHLETAEGACRELAAAAAALVRKELSSGQPKA